MAFTVWHSRRGQDVISIPAIGLDLCVRLPVLASGGALAIMETTNAPSYGPPLHRRRETEIFRVLVGRYLFQVDDRLFLAEAGDVVSVPGGGRTCVRERLGRPCSAARDAAARHRCCCVFHRPRRVDARRHSRQARAEPGSGRTGASNFWVHPYRQAEQPTILHARMLPPRRHCLQSALASHGQFLNEPSRDAAS